MCTLNLGLMSVSCCLLPSVLTAGMMLHHTLLFGWLNVNSPRTSCSSRLQSLALSDESNVKPVIGVCLSSEQSLLQSPPEFVPSVVVAP